ncbi:MAG: MBL fold metallo-hydrolase [Lachnospiraceae bacterium]|jgi:hydroxyacylglutathione hydrolase|nr:MBL fold metallo-hydrolase [Lachnospiraceae bacterium]
MGFKKPYVSEIAPDTYAINEFGLSAQYLLIGDRKALLIDTGCGLGNVREVVRGLTDLPYDVVLTHGHLDHVGGMGSFDRVFLHPADKEMAIHTDFDELRGYADTLGRAGGYAAFDYSPEEIRPFEKMPEFCEIREPYMFDLGGRKAEVAEIPGHTPGSICLFDDKNRILFSGDCCNVNLLIMGCSVETTLQNLKKLETFSGRYDQNFGGHVGFAGSPDCFSQPRDVLENLIILCESVLERQGKAEKEIQAEDLGDGRVRRTYKDAKITYSPDRLRGEMPC